MNAKLTKSTVLRESGCCDGWECTEADVNGRCLECDMPTVDGVAAYGCNWSPIVCKKCGYRSCDGSC